MFVFIHLYLDDIEAVYGPFATEEDAKTWAEDNDELLRIHKKPYVYGSVIMELSPPT